METPEIDVTEIKRIMERIENKNAEKPGCNQVIPFALPTIIETAAPKADEDEIPNVNGDAKELSRIICIIAPDNPKQKPTEIAIKISGRRIFNITCNNFALSSEKFNFCGKKHNEKIEAIITNNSKIMILL